MCYYRLRAPSPSLRDSDSLQCLENKIEAAVNLIEVNADFFFLNIIQSTDTDLALPVRIGHYTWHVGTSEEESQIRDWMGKASMICSA